MRRKLKMKNKYILSLAIIIIHISLMYAQSEIDINEQNTGNDSLLIPKVSVVQDTLVYKVFGMDCPGCHSALEKQVNKLNTVESSSANWINQELMLIVKRDSVVNEKKLFEMIEKANFTPGEKIDK
jgi:copper chaperone CopZ